MKTVSCQKSRSALRPDRGFVLKQPTVARAILAVGLAVFAVGPLARASSGNDPTVKRPPNWTPC